jgi:hypothetical protein
MTNTVTGAYKVAGTNGHVTAVDQYGTIFSWTTNSYGIYYTNGTSLVFTNGHILQNGLTVLTNAAAFDAVGSGYSNATAQAAAAIATATAASTNITIQSLIGLEGLVCTPQTNLPGTITNSAKYFGPWLGSNYVQLAVNSMVNISSNRVSVGGGRIWLVGVNYLPSPLVITNSVGGIASIDIESPAFSQGAMICLTNPCIICKQPAEPSSLTLTLRNLIISSLPNQATQLVQIVNFPRAWIENNWFGNWYMMTNDAFAGLVPPTEGVSGTPNLEVYISAAMDDKIIMRGNSFLGINDLFWAPDH